MVFNIVIVSVLVILIIHYSIDYLKTFLNPSPPMLEDLKYKKYKAMIDEISRPRPDGNLTVDDALSDDKDLTVGDLTVGDLDSDDLGQYFNSKLAKE